MKLYRSFHFVAKVYGIIVTALMLLIFGGTLVVELIKDSAKAGTEIIRALLNWYDNPTGFFFTYLIGYAVIWWRPLWGSIIIILGSLMVSIINIENSGFLIFSIPTFLVGLLYLCSMYLSRDKQTGLTEN